MKNATITRTSRVPANDDNSADVVKLRNITMSYVARDGATTVALKDVSLALNQREFLSLLGPSGCGKTTLLRIAAGLLRPSFGDVLHDEQAASGPYDGLGLVFQTPVLLPWLSVLDNVLLPIRVLKRPVREYRSRAFELLEMTGLAGFGSRYPVELSGGMQQRVALARAIIHDPTLLVMDEPFGALDALTRETMNAELERLWMTTGKSVLFVTHSISEAVFLSDRIIVMSARPGRVVSTIDVDAPRPRSYDMLTGGPLAELASQLRSILGRSE